MRRANRIITRFFSILVAAMLPAILVFWVVIGGLFAEAAATGANRTRAALMNQADRLAFDLDLELTLLDSCFAAATAHISPSDGAVALGSAIARGLEAYRAASRWPLLVAAVYQVGEDDGPYLDGEATHALRLAPGNGSESGRSMLVAVLDQDVLAGTVIPTLTESYFGADAGFGDYAITLRDPAGARRFSSGADDAIEADFERPLFRDSAGFDVSGFYEAFFTDGDRWPMGYRAWSALDPLPYPLEPPASRALPRNDGRTEEQFPIDRYRFQEGGERGRWTISVSGKKRSLVREARLQAIGWSIASAAFLALLYGCVITLYYAVRKSVRLTERERDFVASVTHELKTPVTVILSAGENLVEGIVEQRRVAEYGSIIAKEARRLAETVERLLIMAGLQSAESVARSEPVRAAGLVEAALAKLRATALARGATFSVEIEGEPMIEGSALLLESALEGVVRNAIEYAGGAVRIRSYKKTVGKRGIVVIECRDDGPGVPKPERGQLFEPFYRGDAAIAAGTKGTGIGLYLVRRVARMHGGDARLRFPPDGGTVAELSFRSWR